MSAKSYSAGVRTKRPDSVRDADAVVRDVIHLVARDYNGNLVAYLNAVRPPRPPVRVPAPPVAAFAARSAMAR